MDINLNSHVAAQVVLMAREGATSDGELQAFLQAQDADCLAALVALMWIGRGSFEAEDWDEALATAIREASIPTDQYLMGTPHLGENLEAGMEAMGLDVEDAESALMRY